MSEPMEEDEGPQVAREATSAMHDVANLQDNEDGGPSLEESVLSLNADQARIFERSTLNIKCSMRKTCAYLVT